MTTTGATTSSPAAYDAALVREGFRDKAYKDSGGKWTVGIGFTRIDTGAGLRPVAPGDTMTRSEAIAILREEWLDHERLITRHITRPLTQNQFDVLADMAFQFGAGFLVSGAGGTTGLREAINAGVWEKIDNEICRWYYTKERRDAGVYTRALSRVCQWHGLPWRWLYEQTTPDSIKRDDTGYVIETPYIKLTSEGAVVDMVTPETALARARAYAAAEASRVPKAPEKPRVPASPAPSPPAAEKPVIVVKPPAGVVIKAEDPPKAEPGPAPADPRPAARPKKPVIGIAEPYEPAKVKTVPLDQLPIPGIDPAQGAKAMTDAQRFWGLFWIGAGNILQAAAMRGLVIGALPSWATYLLVDALRDPIILGALTALTVALVSAAAAAPAIIKAGIRKLRKGDAEAVHLTY